MTDTLQDKYLDAKDMTLQATENYTKMVQTIKPATLHIWEHQIQLAKQNKKSRQWIFI